MSRILLTGFEPFGAHAVNPTSAIVEQLRGERIGGYEVIGRVLPVELDGLPERVERLLDETAPALVLNLGLAAGTPAIRLERVALNLADFDLPDNSGANCVDQPLLPSAPEGLMSTLPLRAMLTALLTAGIPAYLSNSAGTYLCNAAMYYFLHVLRLRGRMVPCGFMHVPALPEQVAASLIEHGVLAESGLRLELASMSLDVQLKAVRIALELCCNTAPEAQCVSLARLVE